MELKTISEIAIICATFAYAISQLVDAYVKISSTTRKNHPNANKGGKNKKH